MEDGLIRKDDIVNETWLSLFLNQHLLREVKSSGKISGCQLMNGRLLVRRQFQFLRDPLNAAFGDVE